MFAIPPLTARRFRSLAVLCGSALALSACANQLDFDMRGGLGGGLDTAQAAQQPTANRPRPDARGVISYPGYQVAVAQRGDTVETLAARIGLPATEVARFNGLSLDAPLRGGEVIALPRRVPDTGAESSSIDITSIAGAAIDRAQPSRSTGTGPVTSGAEPIRHRVERGETAFSVARLYNVSPRALAEWNGLGPDLAVREGQYLLIPVTLGDPVATTHLADATTAPGTGSLTPVPPSAATALPAEDTTPVITPTSPNLASERTAATTQSQMAMPSDGRIIRAFSKNGNQGIDIGTSAGAPVSAAEAGEIAAITQDTDQVQIIVIRHPNNLLTVYANVTDITVAKGDRVQRGQKLASVADGDPPFVHFEVLEGAERVDPVPYLS